MKEPRNQPISRYQVGKIMWHFWMDVTATQTALLTGINRNTVNRCYALFRLAIYAHRLKQFQRVVEEVERWMKATSEPAEFAAAPGQIKRGRGTRKQPVFGLFLRQGQVYTEIVPDCKKKEYDFTGVWSEIQHAGVESCGVCLREVVKCSLGQADLSRYLFGEHHGLVIGERCTIKGEPV